MMNHPNNDNVDDNAAVAPANIADDFVDKNHDVVAAVAVNNNDHYANAAANNIHNVDDDPNDDDDDQICQEAIEILQNRLKFPSRLRDQTIVRFAQQLIRNVKNNIHKMVADTLIVDMGMTCIRSIAYYIYRMIIPL